MLKNKPFQIKKCSVGNASFVITLRIDIENPAIPFPIITAPIYLGGSLPANA